MAPTQPARGRVTRAQAKKDGVQIPDKFETPPKLTSKPKTNIKKSRRASPPASSSKIIEAADQLTSNPEKTEEIAASKGLGVSSLKMSLSSVVASVLSPFRASISAKPARVDVEKRLKERSPSPSPDTPAISFSPTPIRSLDPISQKRSRDYMRRESIRERTAARRARKEARESQEAQEVNQKKIKIQEPLNDEPKIMASIEPIPQMQLTPLSFRVSPSLSPSSSPQPENRVGRTYRVPSPTSTTDESEIAEAEVFEPPSKRPRHTYSQPEYPSDDESTDIDMMSLTTENQKPVIEWTNYDFVNHLKDTYGFNPKQLAREMKTMEEGDVPRMFMTGFWGFQTLREKAFSEIEHERAEEMRKLQVLRDRVAHESVLLQSEREQIFIEREELSQRRAQIKAQFNATTLAADVHLGASPNTIENKWGFPYASPEQPTTDHDMETENDLTTQTFPQSSETQTLTPLTPTPNIKPSSRGSNVAWTENVIHNHAEQGPNQPSNANTPMPKSALKGHQQDSSLKGRQLESLERKKSEAAKYTPKQPSRLREVEELKASPEQRAAAQGFNLFSKLSSVSQPVFPFSSASLAASSASPSASLFSTASGSDIKTISLYNSQAIGNVMIDIGDIQVPIERSNEFKSNVFPMLNQFDHFTQTPPHFNLYTTAATAGF